LPIKHNGCKIILCDEYITRMRTIAIASEPQYLDNKKFWEGGEGNRQIDSYN